MQKEESYLTIGEILDEGILLFRKSFKRCFPISLFILLVTIGIFLLKNYYYPENSSPNTSPDTHRLAFSVVFSLFTTFCSIFLGKQVSSFATTQRLDMVDTFLYALKKTIPIIILSILTTFLTLVGCILFIAPGIYLMVSLAFAWGLAVSDNDSIFNALKHSHQMVRSKWWKTTVLLGMVLILGLPVIISFIFFGYIYFALLNLAADETGTLTFILIGMGIACIMYSILAQLSLSLYFSILQALRKETFNGSSGS